MYLGQDWPVANAAESQVYSIDFANDLDTENNETLSTVTATLTVFQGTDADPSSHLYLDPGISGSIASQRVRYLTAGVTYTLAFTVTTSLSNTLELYAHIPCRAVT